MKFGSSNITSVKLGSSNVSAVYVGSTKIYPSSSPYTPPDYAASGIQMYYNPEDPTSYSGSGTTLTDLSGNGYDATIVNAPTFDTSYFTYNGASSQYIYSPDMVSSFNSTISFTVEIWYAPNYTVQGAGGTVMSENGESDPSLGWRYSVIEHRKAPFGSLSFDYAGIWNTSNAITAVNPTATFSNLVWRCQTLTYDGTNGRIYTNGALGRTVAAARQVPWNSGSGYRLLMGAGCVTQQSGAGANYFTGNIGIVRAYNRALSDAEVLQNYNGAKAIYGL